MSEEEKLVLKVLHREYEGKGVEDDYEANFYMLGDIRHFESIEECLEWFKEEL